MNDRTNMYMYIPSRGTSCNDWAGVYGPNAFITDSFTLPAIKSLQRKGHFPVSECVYKCMCMC